MKPLRPALILLVMMVLTLIAGSAGAQEGAETSEATCVRPECLAVALQLMELDARLGNAPRPDDGPTDVLMGLGGASAAVGAAMLIATLFTAQCPGDWQTCNLQFDQGLLYGGVITAVIGVVLLITGGVIRATHRLHRRRDALRRWLRRHDEEASALPFAITF